MMKAVVDKKNFKITLDNEAIKAIRFVYGLSLDLRCKLTAVDKHSLWSWLDDNGIRIFGMDFVKYSTIQPTDDDWNKYERMLNDVVRQILGC
jgi:hypothetical protein